MRITDCVHALIIPFQVTTPTGVKVDRFVICAHPAEKSWMEDVASQSRERPVPSSLPAPVTGTERQAIEALPIAAGIRRRRHRA